MVWLAFLKLLPLNYRLDQVSKYTENDGSLASHYWRREFQTWRGDDQMWPLALDWN